MSLLLVCHRFLSCLLHPSHSLRPQVLSNSPVLLRTVEVIASSRRLLSYQCAQARRVTHAEDVATAGMKKKKAGMTKKALMMLGSTKDEVENEHQMEYDDVMLSSVVAQQVGLHEAQEKKAMELQEMQERLEQSRNKNERSKSAVGMNRSMSESKKGRNSKSGRNSSGSTTKKTIFGVRREPAEPRTL